MTWMRDVNHGYLTPRTENWGTDNTWTGKEKFCYVLWNPRWFMTRVHLIAWFVQGSKPYTFSFSSTSSPWLTQTRGRSVFIFQQQQQHQQQQVLINAIMVGKSMWAHWISLVTPARRRCGGVVCVTWWQELCFGTCDRAIIGGFLRGNDG